MKNGTGLAPQFLRTGLVRVPVAGPPSCGRRTTDIHNRIWRVKVRRRRVGNQPRLTDSVNCHPDRHQTRGQLTIKWEEPNMFTLAALSSLINDALLPESRSAMLCLQACFDRIMIHLSSTHLHSAQKAAFAGAPASGYGCRARCPERGPSHGSTPLPLVH